MPTDLLAEQAHDPQTTPFDYIVVGSGAGGGPLAARLALAGKRVLVLEAGLDPAVEDPQPGNPLDNPYASQAGELREVSQVPAYHGPATEDPDISWSFSVRHYENDKTQRYDPVTKRGDSKYCAANDPSANGGLGKGGIFYPRSSALGGCTAHHAMIVVKPNDSDWNRIARLTGDQSWGAGEMQGYFTRIENCQYFEAFKKFFDKKGGFVYRAARWVATRISPKSQLDWGGHGFDGWQRTSFIDPVLILGIFSGDKTFKKVLWAVFRFLLFRWVALAQLARSILQLRLVQFLDPNFREARGTHGQLAFIPIGTDGHRRTGVREYLLETARTHSDRLVLKTGVLATRIIFAAAKDGPPRAIGVELVEGAHLYQASPRADHAKELPKPVAYYARGEVVLAGGAFNTPQLLMLSGIGEKDHLKEHEIAGPRDAKGKPVADVVDLPGVGRNLQDRYEVSVISQASSEFSTLHNVSFKPGDDNDPARRAWLNDEIGLYATNGGALAVFAKSDKRLNDPELTDPDLFIFGVPAAFRGYYWRWSAELLRATMHAEKEQRDLWSWVILKAYTRNDHGTVRLRSPSPLHPPEICFRSFQEGPPEHVDDVQALLDGVRFVRQMNGNVKPFIQEIQPGRDRPYKSAALEQWIKDEAWGHHACGTCRIGSDRWQADVAKLTDPKAVVDSRFRVHGVANLRVVDASVFPEIPGYFIVTPVFMIAEKAADVLLADRVEYPKELEAAEAAAIQRRREEAYPTAEERDKSAPASWPERTVGLALSGGGIRSATFCLGFLQALAAKNRLRDVDMLSTVSGGGYIGAFLGRLFTRVRCRVADKVGQVQDKLTSRSAELVWLRTHASYLSGEGRADLMASLTGVWRNLLGVYICLGILWLAGFTLLRWLSGAGERATLGALGWSVGVVLSPWWWVPLFLLLGVVVPLWCAFWIAPWPGKVKPHPILPMFAWIALISGCIAALQSARGGPAALVAIVALLLAWPAQEMAQWNLKPGTRPESRGAIARNRLTRWQASSLVWLGVAAFWFVLDTAARTAVRMGMMPRAAGTMALIASVLPFLRPLASRLTTRRSETQRWAWLERVLLGAAALLLAAFLLFALDVIAHTVFNKDESSGRWLFWVTLAVSLALGRAIGFANLASLQPLFGSRLVRTFLGASSEARIGSQTTEAPTTVEMADAADDLPFHLYHPESKGGPLHLFNVCVNETVDAASGRPLRQDKGLSMCVGPCGVSVGRRYHSLWTPRREAEEYTEDRVVRTLEQENAGDEPTALRPLRVASDPQSFHVLAHSGRKAVAVEPLRLGQWMAISGAALSTGAGRLTSLPLALLLGLLNARLGYWWNSGIKAGDRPGRFPPSLVQWIKGRPAWFFRAQSIILNEWRAYFGGPSQRLWNLSDGGHFENTGLYELVRRRLAFMIAVDAGQDEGYHHEDTALLVRRARQDFGAHFRWIEPSAATGSKEECWKSIRECLEREAPPDWVVGWLNATGLGAVGKMKREGGLTAALARITYDDDPEAVSWLLLVKAGVPAEVPLDVRCYTVKHTAFPNESTFDQFLDDDQWESYRVLGELAGKAVLR